MGGPIQSVENLNKTRRLIFPHVRGNSPCLTVFELWYRFFPAFGIKQKHWLVLGLQHTGLWTGTTSVSLQSFKLGVHLHHPACGLQILGLFNYYTCISQSLIISEYVISKYILLFLFLWWTLTDTNFGTKTGSRGTEAQEWVFWSSSEVSGIGTLISLDLKMLMTISSSKENTDSERCNLAMEACKISSLDTPNQSLISYTRICVTVYMILLDIFLKLTSMMRLAVFS